MRQFALWLSWLLMFIVPWEFLFAEGTLGTLVRVAGIALAGVWVIATLIVGRVRRPHPLHVPMALFAVWCGASILWSLDPAASLDQTLTYLQLVLLAFIVWDLYTTPAQLDTALQAYLLGNWLCVGTLLDSFLRGDVERRFSIGMFNENTLAFTIALGIPIAWHLAVGLRGQRDGVSARLAPLLRVANLAFIPAALFSLTLTASRASMGSAACGLVYMAFSLGGLRGGARILLIGGAAAVAIYGVSLIPRDSVQRLENTSVELSEGDWNGRLPIWKEALGLIAEHPLGGVGVNAFHVGAVNTHKAPHDLVLALLAELGLVGFAIFGVLLAGCVLVALRQPPALAAFWLAMLAAWLVGALVHNFEDQKITWLLFGLIAASDGLRETSRQASPGLGARAGAVRHVAAAPGRAR